MTKKAQKIDVFAKSVEKRKKSQHGDKRVVPLDNRRALSGGMYIHLDRRKRVEGGNNVSIRSFKRVLDNGQDANEINDLPCDDFQKMYMT
jgi:hypothetical protein